MTVWAIPIRLAAAAEPPLPVPLWEEREAYWTQVDRRATHTARGGEYLLAAGFAQAVMGTLLIAHAQDVGSENVEAAGVTLLVTGGITTALGSPLILGGSMRAARSMRERGVYGSRTAATIGWSFLGASLFVPIAPFTVPVSIVLGTVQVDVNRRVRERAGLPSLRRDMRWWEEAPLGATITIVPPAGRAARDGRDPEG